VHEALLFSATLRLPEDVGPAAVRAFVQEIERVVEVEDIVHALVGMPGARLLASSVEITRLRATVF
jgi:hypothetical protein